MAKRPLELLAEQRAPDVPPPDRGRLLFVEDVVREIFRGHKSPWWVRHRCCPDRKFRIGRDCAWYERDIVDWLDSLRERSA